MSLWILAAFAAVVVTALSLYFVKERFAVDNPSLGSGVCPFGTNDQWAPEGGKCCVPGGGCVAPLLYQTPAPRQGDLVCPPGTSWGWSLRADMCCGADGCVHPVRFGTTQPR